MFDIIFVSLAQDAKPEYDLRENTNFGILSERFRNLPSMNIKFSENLFPNKETFIFTKTLAH